jgi:hypothetical protein
MEPEASLLYSEKKPQLIPVLNQMNAPHSHILFIWDPS